MIFRFGKRLISYEMFDVSGKEILHRTAVAEGKVVFSNEGFMHLQERGSKKGSIQEMAEIAGIMGAKETSRLLPLCHPLPLHKVKVELTTLPESHSILVHATAITDAKTGVEMEALTAVSISCLTIYDMCKSFDSSMIIQDIKLLSKVKEQIK